MAEVKLTVNGAEVALDVEPRITLAEALRDRLGLTGTHLGCEHGVCGACTVLVDGKAVRSCLMFCVQADGHEVTTVEALGTPDNLHPLQEAFRRHHGLQCGFCTPGFLISAYELLNDRHTELQDEHRLRRELSGVLCRCTGYAGIVAAVREVAAAHPDGVPPPKALGRPLAPRGDGIRIAERDLGGGRPPPNEPASAETLPDLTVPTGEPNETVEVTTVISASPEATWELLADFPRMSRCVPGVELDEERGDDTYAGRVRVHLGPMRMSFAGAARVLERDPEQRILRVVAGGRDASGSGVRVLVTLSAQPSGGAATTMRALARLYLSGRIAQFGRSLGGEVSRQLFAEFGSCVERTLTTGEPAPPSRVTAARLMWRLALLRAGKLLRRILGDRKAS
jgi:aerobic-type carbon monoxide dehydrogenase small subunit (CoxS/CutS family)/carbon monoxide dehydrogenase subunit G